LFDFERGINGLAAEQRLCVRKEQGAASDGSRLLRSASVAEPIDSMLKRWDRFARFIGGRRIRLSNDAAECASPSQQMWCRAPRRRRARLGSDVDKSTLDIDTRSRRNTRRSGHGLLSTFLIGSDVRQIRNRHSEATPAANARRGHLIWVGSLSVDVERVIDSPMSEMRAELIDCHDCGRPVSFSAVSRYSSGRRLWTFW
jgi:hypothetical protein